MSIPVMPLSLSRLLKLGLQVTDSIRYQLSSEELVQDCLDRGEGCLEENGALVIQTGEFTGRSPMDRYIVRDDITEKRICWNDLNQPMPERNFEIILKKVTNYLHQLPEIWVRDAFVCSDPVYRMNIRIINETPSMNLFAFKMLLRPE